MTSTVRDIVTEELALSEAELRERLALMAGERDAFRLVLRAALTALHDCQAALKRESTRRARLTDEYRSFRAKAFRQDAAA